MPSRPGPRGPERQVEAALGIVPRSMVAAVVGVAVTNHGHRLMERLEFPFVSDELPGQAYHAAAGLDLPAARRLIDRWADAACASATDGLARILEALAARSARAVVVGIAAEVRDVPPLATALRSHPLLHTAEGQLAREAVAEAAARVGLPVHYLRPRGARHTELQPQADALGAGAGPPWRAQQKLAAAAALSGLRATRR